jgi:hypothetical protein
MSDSLLNKDGKEIITSLLFPGFVAIWPFWYGVFFNEDSMFNINNIPKDNSVLYICYFLIGLLITYGSGLLMNILGSRLEIFLEKRKYKEKESNDKFYLVWREYLEISFKKDEEPILVKFYSNFIWRYKTILSLIPSLLIQVLIGYLTKLKLITIYISFGEYSFFLNTFWPIQLLFAGACIIYLLFEALAYMGEANILREQLISQYKMKSHKNRSLRQRW